jgi:uncharacterized protein
MSTLRLQEVHRFHAGSHEYLYLVPSAAVFGLDDTAEAVVSALEASPMTRHDLVNQLLGLGLGDVENTIDELVHVRAVSDAAATNSAVAPRILPLTPVGPIPLTTLVVNVTNQCNLGCSYCYEYGEDKIVDTASGRKSKFMSEETARASVDFLLRESGGNRKAHLTFFGGETLLNFPVLKKTIAYAKSRAAEVGKEIDFSLTTNATLLRPEVIDFLAANDVGVTISIDGPKEMQNRFRVFHNGEGSYDVVAPKIRELLKRHTTRPIGARVTLTSQTLDVRRIFHHLSEEMGFREVGFAPVTTAPERSYAIEDEGFDRMLGQFRELAYEFLSAAVENRHHGFSNIKDTLEEIHKGVSKAYPCGAGFGLMGVSTDGDVALCHRFAGSDAHQLGTVREGVDRNRQLAFLESHQIADKTDCSRCWARPLCAGGCYHEAHVRYGDTQRPNLHYCEWIRGWTHTCLEVYGALAERNPQFLSRFDGEVATAEVVV